MKHEQKDFVIRELGKPEFVSPLNLSKVDDDQIANYVPNDERILVNISLKEVRECVSSGRDPLSFEKAGPREMLYFDPSRCKAGIVSCGGLCPGINDVIRGLVMQLSYWYGVKTIYGFKYGYAGLVKENEIPPMMLDPDAVADIHEKGGSILGTSRGPQDTSKIVDHLIEYNINILFCIGGDGTLRGANDITEEINKRGLKISVIAIPKTIDNDIEFIEKTFGFETAFSIAVESIRVAHVEAKGFQNGVGLVKLMGRQSGYIAANAALASQEVNFCLIPELVFDLDGENGLFHHLEKRLRRRSHAVIAIAEGAGQEYVTQSGKDASGNVKLGDIGVFMKDEISKHFKKTGFPVNVRYLDPSYLIRSAKALPSDSIYCTQLAQNAVHAGMAGKTGIMVGIWNNQFTHIPINIAIDGRKTLDPESMFWLNVVESTGQPMIMHNRQQ
ncbi:MAG: ATP-dependent 6-phosphofructokinase [Candidatus Riflebacteria bacterium]|nr:ATP-dependent 6-phosphofructokinase [Candidatus Riflebacteria bacterium]